MSIRLLYALSTRSMIGYKRPPGYTAPLAVGAFVSLSFESSHENVTEDYLCLIMGHDTYQIPGGRTRYEDNTRGSIMTIEPSAIWAGLGTALGVLITAIAFAIRQWSLTRSKTDGDRSTGQLAIDTAQAKGLETLNTIASQSLDVQKDLRTVIIENSKASSDAAAQMRGMLLMLDGHGKLLRDTALAVDDVSAGIAGISKVTTTLQTDIEGSLTGQLGPVVIAIQGIGKQLDILNTTLQTKDEATIKLMERLQFSFGALETTLLKMLEPIALRTLSEIHPDNGKGDLTHDA